MFLPPPGDLGRSPLGALTTGLRWSNHEGHEAGIRRSAETNERFCDRGSLAPRAGTATWHRTLLSLIPSCASWSTDRPDALDCHEHIPRVVANKSVHQSGGWHAQRLCDGRGLLRERSSLAIDPTQFPNRHLLLCREQLYLAPDRTPFEDSGTCHPR